MRGVALAALVALAVAACGTGERPQTPQPREGRAGLQLSGTVGGSQVAVSDGSPDLILGDCDVVGGPAYDLCAVSRDLRGAPVVLTVRNPDALREGETLPVENPGCTGQGCDAITEVAVVDVLLGEERPQRAAGGMLVLTAVEDGRRYAGRLRLELPDGVLSGHFDLVPRPR